MRIILGLLTLDQASRRNDFIGDIAASAHWLARREPQPLSHGLFTGNAGVAVALAVAAKKTGEKELAIAARSRLGTALEQCRETDLFSGKAGVIHAACLTAKLFNDGEYLDRAQTLVEELLQSAEAAYGVIGWRSSGRLDKSREIYTGAAHDAAGVAAALAGWAKLTGETGVTDFAVDVLKSIWANGRTTRLCNAT